MVRISVIIPVYNEIRFIQKTLESVIGDADEIIISDNASTDGTSDICQSFASKYPEIKYIRQKANVGGPKNFYSCLDLVSGQYVRNMGAHDMLSIGSNHSMALLLDKHSDVAMVYPKYVIGLNSTYSFDYFHTYEEFGHDLMSDLASVRVKSMINHLKEFSIYYGLWRSEVFRDVNRSRIFQSLCTDHTALSSTALKGKMLADEKSIFFRMDPHNKQEELWDNSKKRWAKQLLPLDKNVNHCFWPFAVIAEQYDLLVRTFGEDNDLSKELLNFLLSQLYSAFNYSELTLDGMPSIVAGKEEFCLNLMTMIREYKEIKNSMKNNKKINMMSIMKKILKYIIPYGFIDLYRDIKS